MGYLVALAALLAAAWIAKQATRLVTIYEYERGLRYVRGRFAGVLDAGIYWEVRPFTTVQKIDTRPLFVSITGQEVLSSDGVALKVSLAARYRVTDPETATNKVQSYQDSLYLELQLALRQAVGGTPIEELLGRREEIGKRLLDVAAPKAAAMGLELLEVEIKDITFPGELKKIFTQVVKARQEGLAALERARGETAALRNLANAARQVERNPHLMQLRLLQVLGQSSGNTLVLGVPGQSGPIPIRGRGTDEIDSKASEPDKE